MPLFVPKSGTMQSSIDKPQSPEGPAAGQSSDFVKMLSALANKRKSAIGVDTLQPEKYSNGR